MKDLSRKSQEITSSPIREMFNLALGMNDVISFTVGEPDFNTPRSIVDAAIDALNRGEHHYTPNAGIFPLRQAIADTLASTHGISYNPDSEVVVTAGGMEALMLAMLTILDPGDKFIISDPCWTNYSRQIQLCSAAPLPVNVYADNNFIFRAEDLENAIASNVKGFILNSPANPTGGIASLKSLERLAEIAIKYDLFVISDEVYSSIVYDNLPCPSIATLPGMKERTIIVNSFSKTYAMTGWRVGYALGPARVIGNMVKLQENVAACVNSAAQYGALEALTGPQTHRDEMISTYAKRRNLIIDGFKSIKGLTCYAPEGAFYAFVNIRETGMSSKSFAEDLLQKAKVIVVPGHAFGKDSDYYIRLSFATSEENIIEGLARIRTYMNNFK